VIRIGVQGTQVATYVAGIYGNPVTGSAVVVSSTGQLGVTVSSERFKTAIVPMRSDTSKLGQLRPVSFKLKSDATGTRRYGLIAEEVAKVYPELVIRDESGRIDGVRYDELAPMLLNDERNAVQAAQIRELTQRQKQFDIQELHLRDLQRKLALMQSALAKLDGR
jgi:trimeric autotransporter adhesin